MFRGCSKCLKSAAIALPTLALVLLGPSLPAARGADGPTLAQESGQLHGAPVGTAKAAGDTILLMGPTGSGAPYIGDFEDGWNGWTSHDVSVSTEIHWQVSGYAQAVAGNLAAWCGTLDYPSCDVTDSIGGYGNGWEEFLEFRHTVADPAKSTTVTVTATLQHGLEAAYDFVSLAYRVSGQVAPAKVRSWDGTGIVAVDESWTILPSEYIDGTDIRVLWLVETDGGWSDEDCLRPSAGACQIDDIDLNFTTGGVVSSSHTDFQDGTFGGWEPGLPPGVGDFAALWSNLHDADPCAENSSWQVAFIDNGMVVPETGGSTCVNWCYGPNGYIVNTTGGLRGPEFHLENEIWSPVMAWPDAGFEGVRFAFDVMRHEILDFDAPGMFFTWKVRSADSEAGIEHAAWVGTNFLFYGNPSYVRFDEIVSQLMVPGRTHLQIALVVTELGFVFGWTGNDGYPAPYFDNVAVKVYPVDGPELTVREIDLAQDGFPAVDTADFSDLGALSVRFDMANNIAPSLDAPRVDPGDSIVIKAVPVRAGSSLLAPPVMHYTMQANPLFDPFRTFPTAGQVVGTQSRFINGAPVPDTFYFDLPDTGLIFPGDIVHYYFSCEDNLAGDTRQTVLPADLGSFGDFSDPLSWDRRFTMRALPSLMDVGGGAVDAPEILFWNDAGDQQGDVVWHGALADLGLRCGLDYDEYRTAGPRTGVGNGLGGRTAGPSLDVYQTMLYGSGDASVFTISSGVLDQYGWGSADGANDVVTLNTWLAAGSRSLLLTGDGLVSDLCGQSLVGLTFAAEVMGLDIADSDLRPLIGDQVAPLVLPVAGNPVFPAADSWLAYGSCPQINAFDAVVARAGAERLAEFAGPAGAPGAYAYAAATYNLHDLSDRVISLPYDLSFVRNQVGGDKAQAPLPARAKLLRQVLHFFGISTGIPEPTDVPAAERLAVSSHPNPFNPATRIDYRVARPGPLVLKVFDVQGRLVRTLIDGTVAGSGHVMWDGRDDNGGQVASGVYFTEARSGGETRIAKMALVK